MLRAATLLLALALSATTQAIPRDAQQKNEFRKSNPCPSTGSTKGACSGYHVDHKKALMNGGKDHPSNMQWLAEPDHKAKTKQDFSECKGSYSCKHKTAAKRLPWQPAKKTKAEKKPKHQGTRNRDSRGRFR